MSDPTNEAAGAVEYWGTLLSRPAPPPGPQFVLQNQIVVERKDLEAVVAAWSNER